MASDPSETVVVTGGNRGIGLSLAREAAARGYRVIATCRSLETAGSLAAASANAIEVHRLDVTDQGSIRSFADAIEERRQTVDLLINNAGIYGRGAFATSMPDQSFSGMDYGLWREVLETNLVAPFAVTQALLPTLRRSRRPRVVMMSSDLGSIANNRLGQSYAYRTSKTALNMVARSLAKDLSSEGVVVIAMAPGWCRTDLGGPEAPVDPRDSARGQFDLYERLDATHNGGFWNFKGEAVPW
jgi:NAD(P)-dependent dehydrogenase (short-subunit alcohol dehydrogenase family)